MLKIDGLRTIEEAAYVEEDEYTPLIVKTYDQPIGASFYRTGDFECSLVEVPIDPESGALRGFTVVSIDRLGEEFHDIGVKTLVGLPVIAKQDIPDRIQDEKRDVLINLSRDRIFVDWSHGLAIDTAIYHGKLVFYVGSSYLLGAGVVGISEVQASAIMFHLGQCKA